VASFAVVVLAASPQPAVAETEAAAEAPTPINTPSEAPIAAALEAASPDVRRFDQHITTLANPFFQGRVPGSRGNEIARQYIEFWFDAFGLERPFTTDAGERSFRQPFGIGGRVKIVDQQLTIASPAGDTQTFEPGVDFTITGLGGEGPAEGGAVFVGYGLEEGPDGYTNFPNELDLTGRIAVMFRFEPVDQAGASKFASRGRWSDRASFSNKVAAVASRNADGLIIINPPGVQDPRSERLLSPGVGGRNEWDLPVMHMTFDAGDTLLRTLSGEDRSIEAWRTRADTADTASPVRLDGAIVMQAELDIQPLEAQNIGALLPGRGELARELIVIGAHFDHIGDGGFGTPSTIDGTHNGADDNASGTAGVLLMAERLAAQYRDMPSEAEARSVLFLTFDAEESGLNGARFYVEQPLRSLDQHYLMVNFDMIGRVKNGGLSVTGTQTAEGMGDWLRPKFERSPLNIVQPTNVSRRSDHAPFYFNGEIPVLFAIINPLHSDYHTAADDSWKINRHGAVDVVDLFEDIIMDAATRRQTLAVIPPTPQPPASRVLFGVVPRNAGEGAEGVILAAVTPGTAAAAAGVQPGDHLIEWDGEPVDTVAEWRWALAEHAPGDTVDFAVLRDNERVELNATLRAR
jgi:hypothetical protein